MSRGRENNERTTSRTPAGPVLVYREVSFDRNTATETQNPKLAQGGRKPGRKPTENDQKLRKPFCLPGQCMMRVSCMQIGPAPKRGRGSIVHGTPPLGPKPRSGKLTLCYAMLLPGRKSGFRAEFRPDSKLENIKICPPAGRADFEAVSTGFRLKSGPMYGLEALLHDIGQQRYPEYGGRVGNGGHQPHRWPHPKLRPATGSASTSRHQLKLPFPIHL